MNDARFSGRFSVLAKLSLVIYHRRIITGGSSPADHHRRIITDGSSPADHHRRIIAW